MEASFARSILVNAPMAVVAIDETGAVRTSNSTADAYFRRALTCPEPLRISELIPDIDLAGLMSTDGLGAFNARSRNSGEGVHLRADRGDGIDAYVDIQAARFSAKGENFLTLFIQDVTSVVIAEAAVQDLRLQITYNWRLNSLGEIASMVAHELNQPLSAILNYLGAARSLVARPELDRTKILKFIGSAEGQAERASDVIRRLRSLMSRDTGFHTEEWVFEVVSEILPILNINARELDAVISVEIGREDKARCDRVQLQQLVINLVRNALDAPATDQRRRVKITGEPTNDMYLLLVEDNGPGVSDAVAAHLFDPLFSTKTGGMGLGLSICRTIVEAHGGSIECVSSSLGGAAFAFTLNSVDAHV